LQQHGIPNEKLHLERFVSIGDTEIPIVVGNKTADADVTKTVACATLDGKDNKVSCEPGETILDALLNAGVNAPYSCKEGVCSTCMAKLINGRVQMLNAQSLTDIDMKAMHILTCKATCLTKDVEISYDNL